MAGLLSQVFGLPVQGMAAYQNVPRVFIHKYHAYSPAYWNSENREKLESGDKIVMPASALDELSRMNIQFPIMFEITHDSEILPKKSHCGVMEFTAPEGKVYLPLWMIDNLGLSASGDSIVELKTTSIPKGNFVQFQAHETKFAQLKNPRVVLERALRSYSCLTVGDTIQINFANHTYKLDVIKIKPEIKKGQAPPAISIIETDIKVDFIEPRDYKEWEKKQKIKLKAKEEALKKAIAEADKDDDGFFINNNDKSEKKEHFSKLNKMGLKGNKIKNKNEYESKTNKKYNNKNNNYYNNGGGFNKPIRGQPLGTKKKGTALGSSSIKSQGSVKKIEEIIGNLRYIFEIDADGKKTLIRRLPLRKQVIGTAKSTKK